MCNIHPDILHTLQKCGGSADAIHKFSLILNDDVGFTNDPKQLPAIVFLWNHYQQGEMDFQKSETLDVELRNLDDELNMYIEHYGEFDDGQMDYIKNLFLNWKKTINKRIVLQDMNGTNYGKHIHVKINRLGRITVDGLDFGSTVNTRSTLHFKNCQQVIISIATKINHLTLEDCNQVNVKVIGGFVSGMDTIKCNHVSYVFDDNNVYYMDVSSSTECTYYIPEDIALRTEIITAESFNLLFCTLNVDSKSVAKRFKKNRSLFDTFNRYAFLEQDGSVEMYDKPLNMNNILPVFLRRV